MHKEAITRIIENEFAQKPQRIVRMGNGICNEVYRVDIGTREVFVRLHSQPRYLFGSHNHTPIFRTKGIPVPEILAEDYSSSLVGLAYQVLSKIDGEDLGDVIHTLNAQQLKAIAKDISDIFTKLRDVPNNGKFGVLWGDGDDLVDSWTAEVARMTKHVRRWGTQTGVLDSNLAGILEWINTEYKLYFDSVLPITYFGDICAKNVMIHEGRFSGLVDLDALAQGDPLEAIGRIKASWYGTDYGRIYTDAVTDEQQLTPEQLRTVTMYALLNRTYWTLENGVQFNQNTSTHVDRQREMRDKAIVQALYNELLDE